MKLFIFLKRSEMSQGNIFLQETIPFKEHKGLTKGAFKNSSSFSQ